jgi:hypothetical protein
VFIDHAGLEGGDDYESKIASAVRNAEWFILICSGSSKSGKDMNWCFFETGQFRSRGLEGQDSTISNRGRITYLYDADRPTQLARYQGIFVSPVNRAGKTLEFDNEIAESLEFENTELYSFLETILGKSSGNPLRDLRDPGVSPDLSRAIGASGL